MRKEVQARIHLEFKQTLDSLYPDTKSMTEKTRKLNEKLIEMLRK